MSANVQVVVHVSRVKRHGLVPENKILVEDAKSPVGDLILTFRKLLKKGEGWISGKTMYKRAKQNNALVGERHAFALLTAAAHGCIPKKCREHCRPVFPKAIHKERKNSNRCIVLYLYWNGGRWCPGFRFMEDR